MQNHTSLFVSDQVPQSENNLIAVDTGMVLTEGPDAGKPCYMMMTPAAAEVVAAGRVLPGGPPPHTDRGVEFSVDWLSFTFYLSRDAVSVLVLGWMGVGGGVEPWQKLPKAGYGFQVAEVGPGGARLYSEPVDGSYCLVQLPGVACGSISLERLRADFLALLEMQVRFNVTRIDTAFDTDLMTVAQVDQAMQANELRTLAKRSTFERQQAMHGIGHTCKIGSRSSERYLRVYANHPEKGRAGVTRVELEMKDERALAVFLDLLTRPADQWAARSLAHLMDFVGFQADWWAVFCAGAERAYFRLKDATAASIERAAAWVRKQVAPVLAVLEQVKGFNWLMETLDQGEARWSDRHRLLLTMGGVVPG